MPRRCAAAGRLAGGGDILDPERHQLRAAQRADKAEQQQRAVAPAARSLIAGCQQLAQHRQGQRGGFLHRAAVGAEHALQRALDVAMRRVPRQIVEAVHLAECGQPAADGGGRVAVGQAGEIGADGRRRGRHRDETVCGAPRRKNAPSRPCRRAAWRRRWPGARASGRRRARPARRRGAAIPPPRPLERLPAAGCRPPWGATNSEAWCGHGATKIPGGGGAGKPNNSATRDNWYLSRVGGQNYRDPNLSCRVCVGPKCGHFPIRRVEKSVLLPENRAPFNRTSAGICSGTPEGLPSHGQ